VESVWGTHWGGEKTDLPHRTGYLRGESACEGVEKGGGQTIRDNTGGLSKDKLWNTNQGDLNKPRSSDQIPMASVGSIPERISPESNKVQRRNRWLLVGQRKGWSRRGGSGHFPDMRNSPTGAKIQARR